MESKRKKQRAPKVVSAIHAPVKSQPHPKVLHPTSAEALIKSNGDLIENLMTHQGWPIVQELIDEGVASIVGRKTNGYYYSGELSRNGKTKDYSTGYTFKSENYQEEGIPLIRINNIRKGFIDLTDTAYLSDGDYLLSPKDIAKSGDIVLSMSGTIGMSAVIPSDVVKCSINQRILRFTPKDIDPDFLALVLNSIVGIFQLGRIGTGGVQTNISYKDIQNILIPVFPNATKMKIAELVRKSHEARKKSKELLIEAKRKVEEMIEKGNN